MKLLIVEGNNKETRIEREKFGIKPYHIIFQDMLKYLIPNAVIDIVFPADTEKKLPSTEQLKLYDGLLWTGSSLSVLDDTPSVNQQLNFANSVFKSGIPFYGSCWGLQVAAHVAGGVIGKSNNGLELGISKSIKLTESGKKSPFLKNRTDDYRALCIHYDEIITPPKNATILAYNEHSKVQAITFNYLKSTFFGVQYHPEFKPSDMALIISFLSDKLIKDDFFNSQMEADEFILNLIDINHIPQEVLNYKLHTQDIKSWLNLI